MGYIYKITNNINQKIYIGKTTKTVEERFKEHKKKAQEHPNRYLYDAMNHYGYDNFSISTIDQYPDEELDKWEKYWIKYYNTTDENIGYNLTEGGEGGNTWDKNTHKEASSEKMRQAQLKDNYIPISKESLIQDLKEHKTFTDLKMKYNCTRDTLINRFQLYFNKTPEELGLVVNPFAKKEVEDKKALYQDIQQGILSNQEICQKYGMSTTTFSNLCHEYFNQTPTQIRGGKKSLAQQEANKKMHERGKEEGWYRGSNNGTYKALDQQKFLQMIQDGERIEDIADYFHISKPTVSVKAKEYFNKPIKELRVNGYVKPKW